MVELWDAGAYEICPCFPSFGYATVVMQTAKESRERTKPQGVLLMGQGTMLLEEAAVSSKVTTEELAREAFEGRLTLHSLPPCTECGEDGPCKPSCGVAGTQVVWLGDWFNWYRGARV